MECTGERLCMGRARDRANPPEKLVAADTASEPLRHDANVRISPWNSTTTRARGQHMTRSHNARKQQEAAGSVIVEGRDAVGGSEERRTNPIVVVAEEPI